MQMSITNMAPSIIKLCTIFVLGISIASTDSNVTINVHGLSDTNGSYSCNTSIVLTCEITSYKVSMEWRIDGELKSDCFLKNCYSYPPFPGNYNFTNDIADTGLSIFNLTINPLIRSDRKKSFVCSAEAISANVTLQVTGENDNFNISYTDDQSLPYIDALTGCFDSNTTVEFIWTKTKVGSTNATSIYKREDGIVLPCTSVCIDSGRIQRKSTLSFKEEAYGDKYTFQVEVKYENVSRKNSVYYFGREFRLKDDSSQCSINCDDICILLIVIGVCFVIYVIVGCFVLYVMLVVCPTKQGDSTEDKRETTHIEIILNTFSGILWIVIFILFICSLLLCCSYDVACCCCKIVLILRYVLGVLFGINVILWLILLYVLYKRKDKDDEEGNIYFKTKVMKVRIVSSTIPMVGLFPVCGWMIRIYRYGNRIIHDKHVTSVKKTRELPSIPDQVLTINRIDDQRKKSQKRVKKEQDKIDQLFKQTSDEQVKEDQISASGITIVKPKGTDKKNMANIQKSPDARSALIHTVTQQLSQNSRAVLTRSQDHNKEHEKNIPDNQNHSPHSDENPQRKKDETNQQSGSKNKSESKDEVNPKTRRSRKETDENKSTKNKKQIITDAHTGNTRVTKTGFDRQDSGVDDSPSNISKSDNSVQNRKKSRKNEKETLGSNNTKQLSAESHNGNTHVTKTGSGPPDSGVDDIPSNISKSNNIVPNRKKSRKIQNEKKGQNNTKQLSAESHNGNTHVTKAGSDDPPDSGDDDSPSHISKSDNIVQNRKKSRKNEDETQGSNNTKPLSAESHNGSEIMKRTLSANFDDKCDATTTVSIDSDTKM